MVIASMVVFGVGVDLAINGDEPVGSQLIGAGATGIGSAIVGLFVAKVSATLARQTQEEVEARREHKRTIDQLMDRLINAGRSVTAIDGGGMDWLVVELQVGTKVLGNLMDIPNSVENTKLWDDLSNHWRDLKSKADNCVADVAEHNRKVRQFADRVEDSLREKAASFADRFEPVTGSGPPDSRMSIINGCLTIIAGRLGGQSRYVLRRPDAKGDSRVDSGELTTLNLPEALERAFQYSDTFASHPGDATPEVRELVQRGKEQAILEYRRGLAAFLGETISDSADELRGDDMLAELIKEKDRLDLQAAEVEKDLFEIKVSKSLRGSCRYVRTA